MPDTSTEELWFFVSDLLPLVEHRPRTATGRPTAQMPEQLLLMAQGRLRYLVSDARPPLLVDALDPSSVQRVYAIGHSYRALDTTWPASIDRYGFPHRIGALTLYGTEQPPLISQLQTAAARGCDWLVVTVTGNGRISWLTQPTPHPAPPVRWRTAPLQVYGLPGTYWGEFAANQTHHGWLIARFGRDVAEQIAATVATLDQLPAGLDRIRVVEAPDDPDDATTVGVDPDGFWRVGLGWHWVSPQLAPDGPLLPFTGPIPPNISGDELPTLDQDVYRGLGCLMWLDGDGDLVVRTVYENGALDPSDTPGPPEYGNIDPHGEWQFRAAEHLLRQAADSRQRLAPLASRFTPAEVEQLLTAATALPTASPPAELSEQQLELLADLRQLRGQRLSPSGPNWRESTAAPWRRP